MLNQHYLSTMEVAKLLGISRIAVFKRIKKGDIKAIKIGKNYAIPVENVSGKKLSQSEKQQIIAAVDKTVAEYGEVLKKLGQG